MEKSSSDRCELQKEWDSLLERTTNTIRLEVRAQLDAHRSEVHDIISEWSSATNKTLHQINLTLQQIVAVALNKPTGFTGKDVLCLLGGVGVFMIALIFGLDQLGVLATKMSKH